MASFSNQYNENDQVIVNIVNAFYTGAKVSIAGTALYTMNQETNGAVMSAINMIAGVANKYFVTGMSVVPNAIGKLSMTANDIVVSSINDCASQLYQTGAALITVFSGLLKYALNYGPEIVGAVGASVAVTTFDNFTRLEENDKKMYLRRYLARVLNGIVDIHSRSVNVAQEVKEGIKAANCVKQSGELINEVANLSREELAEMVGHVIPYMRSAEYNLSSEDLSFMAGGVPIQPFDGKNVAFQIARLVQKKESIVTNDRDALQEMKDGDVNDSNQYEDDDYSRKRHKPNDEETPIDREIKKIDRMLYLLNELNCTSSSDLCRTHSESDATKKVGTTIFRTFSTKGGRKTKKNKNKKRKPIPKRNQTRRVQRKQTKRAPKKLRKKQTRK